VHHADRSLEIVAVGLGQAGGNIAAEFQRRGYRALAFNTAKTDLSSLGAGRIALPDSQRIYIGLEGLDGAGSDAEYGRECLAAHAAKIRAAIADHAEGADVVVVAAGLGGGTGSCAAELLGLIEGQGLPIVILTTLPHGHESGIAKVNALRAVRDLAKGSMHGWVLIDNARLARLHHDAPISSYFETINRDIVDPIDVFNRLNHCDSTHALRTLDGEDLRALILAGGVLNYHARQLSTLDAAEVLETVRSSLADNPIMPGGSELGTVAYLGLVIEASERALASSPFSLYEEVAERLKRETGGAAVYIGLYRVLGSEQSAATVRVLSSARALPASIREMVAEAEREAGTLQNKAQQNLAALDLGGLDRLTLIRRPVSRNTRTAAPARGSEPASARRVEPVQEPALENTQVEELRRMVVNGPEVWPVAKRNGERVKPSRGRFERLANAFHDAHSDDQRAAIARQLTSAQDSSDALERFYAVNAMARIDPGYFSGALRNAACDADPHVSDLARRALARLGKER
jgi:cell division GTPase FtsZ